MTQIRDSMAQRGWAADNYLVYMTSLFVLTSFVNCLYFRSSDAAMSHTLSGASETHLQRSRALKMGFVELLWVQGNSQWYPRVHGHLTQAPVADAKHNWRHKTLTEWVEYCILSASMDSTQSKTKILKCRIYNTKNYFSVFSGWYKTNGTTDKLVH